MKTQQCMFSGLDGMIFWRLLRHVVVLGICTTSVLQGADPRSAIVLLQSSLMVNGAEVAQVQSGATVLVLGEKADSAEFIVQYTTSDGQKVVGMIPQGAVALTKTSEPAPVPQPVESRRSAKTDEMSAIDFAKQLKEDKKVFVDEYRGQQVQISGAIEKSSLENLSGSSERQLVVTLATSSGLPKVKVRLSPSLAKNREVLKQYTYFPDWFYGYYGSTLEFRQSSMNQVHARVSYKRTTTYTDSDYYANGRTYSSKHSTEWFPIFSPGDPMTIEGFVKGAGLDIEIDGALLISPMR